MEGLWCRWAITRFWQAFHITFLEYIGQRIGELRMAPYLRHEPAVLRNSDNMAACVAQLKGSKSTAIDTAHRFSKTNAALVDLDMRSFQNHMAGRLLWFADAISRDKLVELNSVCHTLHIRHKNVGLNEQVRDFIGGLEVEMLFVSADLRMALPSPANAGSGKVVRFETPVRPKPKRKRMAKRAVEGVLGLLEFSVGGSSDTSAQRQTHAVPRPKHSKYGGEADEVISHFCELGWRTARKLGRVLQLVGVVATLITMLAGRWPRRGRVVARAVAVARLLCARGILGMAATAAAVTRGHVPSHQQQYGVPVRPPVVKVWYLKAYNYSPTGRIADVQRMERMQQDDYYQFPAELDAGEYRSRDDMLQMLFTASAFGDRGVRFAYWYEHGTVSAPMPTTYDQLQRWIIAGDFQQAFYINEDLLETPDFLDEEAASDARIDDLLNPSSRGAHCDYCGTWCEEGEYDSDWRGTGLDICHAGEHEDEKAESEAFFWRASRPCSPRHYRRTDGRHDDDDDHFWPVSPNRSPQWCRKTMRDAIANTTCTAYDNTVEVIRFPPPRACFPQPSPLLAAGRDDEERGASGARAAPVLA